MSTELDRAALFERVLCERIRESLAWRREIAPQRWSTTVAWPVAIDSRSMPIDLHDGEIDIAFSVGPTGIGMAPYELNASIPSDDPERAVIAIVDFLADIIGERTVLAMRRGWATGGRTFLDAADLAPEGRDNLEWIASWRGTHDWNVPR